MIFSMKNIRIPMLAALLPLALCACDPGPSPDELKAMKAKRADAAATAQLDDFNKLKSGGRPDLALDIAEDLLRKYPNSQAAAKVRPELDALREEIHAVRDTARLVLRRHPQWGESVYLLSERGPFVCAEPCQVTFQVDGETRTVPGEIPSTGEHAVFVEDFAWFAAHLADAKIVSFDVQLRDAGAKTLAFEVGGYDPATIGTP